MAGSDGPVFIVGQARSGSSILYRLLQEHPRFRPARGLNLTESHLLDAVVGAADLGTDSVRAFAELDDAGWQALLDDLRAVEPRRQLAIRLPRRLLVRSVPLWRAVGGAATVRAYVAHATRGRGVERLVEKTPQHLPWARHLLDAFDDARLLVISRHPLAAYASFRRRATEDPDATWADIGPSAFAARWRADVAAVARAVDHDGDRVRVERYEHLVADADGFQRALFTWLGEAPLDEVPTSAPVNPNAPASEARQLFGAVQDLGRDWTEHVSAADADRLERELAGPMALLGYRPAAR